MAGLSGMDGFAVLAASTFRATPEQPKHLTLKQEAWGLVLTGNGHHGPWVRQGIRPVVWQSEGLFLMQRVQIGCSRFSSVSCRIDSFCDIKRKK